MSLLLATGELVAVDQQRAPGRSYGEGFVILFTKAAAEIARTIEHASTLRVLLALPEHLDFETWRKVDQALLGRQLGISRPAVTKAMLELHAREVIERKGKGPATTWRMSLDWGWRGNVESFHAAKEKRGRNRARPNPDPARDDCRRRDIM